MHCSFVLSLIHASHIPASQTKAPFIIFHLYGASPTALFSRWGQHLHGSSRHRSHASSTYFRPIIMVQTGAYRRLLPLTRKCTQSNAVMHDGVDLPKRVCERLISSRRPSSKRQALVRVASKHVVVVWYNSLRYVPTSHTLTILPLRTR